MLEDQQSGAQLDEAALQGLVARARRCRRATASRAPRGAREFRAWSGATVR